MSACQFCGRGFSNRQAVKAHLKSCAAYRDRGSRPNRIGSLSIAEPDRFASDERDDPAADSDGADLTLRQLQRRLSSERVRLQLRELDDTNADLDRQGEAKRRERERNAAQEADAARASELARQEAAQRAADATARQERREAAERERQATRRATIQEVKRQAVDEWFGGFAMPTDLKPRIRIAIERALEPLPLEELPMSELVELARGIRDSLYREVKDGIDQAASRAQQRKRLMDHGVSYAQRELLGVEGLDAMDKWRIERVVNSELAAVTGEESTDDIEDWIDEILDDEGVGYADDDE